MDSASLRLQGRQRDKPQPTGHVVHFKLTHPSARHVCIAGTFNNWKAEAGEMAQQRDGTWVKDLTLKPGTYEYRLVVDGKWMPDPQADHTVLNRFGERNSLLSVR